MMPKRFLWLEDYRAFRYKLLAGLAVLIALLLCAFCWTVLKAVQKDRQVATMQTQSFVRAIESHVSYTIESVDLSLISFANAARALTSNDDLDLGLIERLLSRSRDIDSNFWLIFIDAKGRGVAASNELDVHGLSFAQEDYFKAQLKPGAGLFVGSPHTDKRTRRHQFVISRRVQSATGEFLGVIAAPINARHFAYMFDNARFDKDVSITLTHQNGNIIAREPLFEETFGKNIAVGRGVKESRQAMAKTVAVKSQVDGVPRIYSYRKLDNMPLIVAVGVSNPVITDSGMHILLEGGLGLLLVIAVMSGSCHFVLTSYKNLEDVVESRTLELKRANVLLNQSQTALRNLAAHQNRLKEEERTNIAREVHDELGGCLTGIKAYISAVAANPADEGGRNKNMLLEALKMADTAVDTVRRIITDLRPSVLDQLGIWAALEWGTEQFEQRTGIRCALKLDEVKDREVDPETATMIFRIVQESLTNVVRHAQASNVVIRGKWKEGRAVIEIEDDGIGIEAGELLDQESWGIMGMHERAQHAGATLKISGQPGRGTVVSLYLQNIKASEADNAAGNETANMADSAAAIKARKQREYF